MVTLFPILTFLGEITADSAILQFSPMTVSKTSSLCFDIASCAWKKTVLGSSDVQMPPSNSFLISSAISLGHIMQLTPASLTAGKYFIDRMYEMVLRLSSNLSPESITVPNSPSHRISTFSSIKLFSSDNFISPSMRSHLN